MYCPRVLETKSLKLRWLVLKAVRALKEKEGEFGSGLSSSCWWLAGHEASAPSPDRWHHFHMAFSLCVCLCSPFVRTAAVLGSTLMVSFSLDYLCKDLISKLGHILRCLGLGCNVTLCVDTIQPITRRYLRSEHWNGSWGWQVSGWA